MNIAQQIKSQLKARRISQQELAMMIGMPYQNLSAALRGKRHIPVKYTIYIDRILGFQEGFTKKQLVDEEIIPIIKKKSRSPYEVKKSLILNKINENGGFWSYSSIPEHLSDDDIIEKGLVHLEFEDMHLLFEIWSYSHVKKVWKQRLVSQKKRMNILNTLLGILFFNEKPI